MGSAHEKPARTKWNESSNRQPGLLGVLAKEELYSPVRQTSVGFPPGTKANPALGLLIQEPEWQRGSAGRFHGPGAKPKTNKQRLVIQCA